MTEPGERISDPRTTVEELAETFREFDGEMLPHHLPAFYHAAANHPKNSVIDGVLHVWDGRKITLASEEELAEEREFVETAEAELTERIGLQDPSLLHPVKDVVRDIAIRNRALADGREAHDPNLARSGWHEPSVDVFFRAVKEVAALTGETYRVYGNAFQTMDAEIDANTDTTEILVAGFVSDRGVSGDLARNPHLDDDYKQRTSVEELVIAYGLGPAILEVPEV
ncbi:MAG: hypothetical protein ACHQT9_00980 [Candidatus Saccharimonadales bacterium]